MRDVPNAQKLADSAVDAAKAKLVGSRVGKARIDSLFHYGAVEIDTVHLVVWILLSGLPDDELPRWWFGITDYYEESQPARVDPELLLGLAEVQTVVREELSRVGWPDAEHARVGVDSSHRMYLEPGIDYFR